MRLQMITPEQCRAGRALVNWSQRQLAAAAEVGYVTVQAFERGQTSPRVLTLRAIKQALEAAGVLFVDENGAGPGVRLRDRTGKKQKS
jgi:transcriptional regulator with XRE-family HTH domain